MLSPNVRVFVCTVPQDMRRSFDALALLSQKVVGQDPMSGALFLFVNKHSTRVKVLWWDGNGYCILYKRLHRALFRLPKSSSGEPALQVDGQTLATILRGVAVERKKASQ